MVNLLLEGFVKPNRRSSRALFGTPYRATYQTRVSLLFLDHTLAAPPSSIGIRTRTPFPDDETRALSQVAPESVQPRRGITQSLACNNTSKAQRHEPPPRPPPARARHPLKGTMLLAKFSRFCNLHHPCGRRLAGKRQPVNVERLDPL